MPEITKKKKSDQGKKSKHVGSNLESGEAWNLNKGSKKFKSAQQGLYIYY